ncbi:MAG: hypothetical protein LUG91_05150 [Ruminococcus sp.]|nr:hypothetical protein [Ruminococcus sp.]
MANRITFRFNTDRICIWKNTVRSLGNPQYIHLLINEKEKQMFIQVCDHDKDAFRLYYNKRSNGREAEFHVNAKRLMKYLAKVVSVDYNGPSIRFDGILMEDGITVFIDLRKYEVLNPEDYIEE